jgi:acetyltransferase
MNEQCPSQYRSRVILKNGGEVFVRPIRETDGPLILELFRNLSPQSLYRRFLSKIDTIPDKLLYRLTHIDYHKEFGLAAAVFDGDKETLVAVARYAGDRQNDSADLAIAVLDAWQNLGLGKLLLVKITAIAKEKGIKRFTGLMDSENPVIRRPLQKLGYKVRYSVRSGFYEMEIIL